MASPTDRPLRLLASFHYMRGKDMGDLRRQFWPDLDVRIFGDSGAFSALNAGAPVSVDEYAEWLGVNARHLACYANLDVIGDHVASARHLATLERRGLRPLPVFHLGSPFEALERLIDAGYPYICLGGCVGKNSNLLMRFAIRCFKIARAKGKGTQFHGFGLTNSKAIVNLPWYSVDSSSWLRGSRFALLDLFDPGIGDFRRGKLFSDDVDRFARLIRTYGGDPVRFRDRRRYHYSLVANMAGMSYRACEAYARERHGSVTFKGNPDRPGLHLYLVDAGTLSYFRGFLDHYRQMQKGAAA